MCLSQQCSFGKQGGTAHHRNKSLWLGELAVHCTKKKKWELMFEPQRQVFLHNKLLTTVNSDGCFIIFPKPIYAFPVLFKNNCLLNKLQLVTY